MGFWLPQNLQRRLLLYVLQQISLFSNIDTSNIDVSIGSKSKFNFYELELDLNDIDIPNVEINRGFIKNLDIQLNVSGGVTIEGSDLTFTIRPRFPEQNNFDQFGFSLLKSIHDLTKSVVQFTDSAGSESSDGPDYDNEEADPSTKNKTDEETKKQGGTMKNMRNKAVNMVLSKISIIIRRIVINVLPEIGEESDLVIKLEEVSLTTRDKNIRHISMKDIKILHKKKTDDSAKVSSSGASSESGSDRMMQSMYYSRMEGTSMYMSAMDTLMESKQIEQNQLENKERGEAIERQEENLDLLFSLDRGEVKFEGISSLEDITITDLSIDIEKIYLSLQKCIQLKKSVLVEIFKFFLNCPKTGSEKTTNTEPYKRFQKEQHLSENSSFSFFCMKELLLGINDSFELYLRQLVVNKQENEEYTLSIFSIGCNAEDIGISHQHHPALEGLLVNGRNKFTLDDSLEVSLNYTSLNQLVEFYKAFNVFLELINRNPERIRKPIDTHSTAAVNINIEKLVIFLKNPQQTLKMTIYSTEFDTDKNSLQTGEIELLNVIEGKCHELLTISKISFHRSNTKIHATSYDENFNSSILFTNVLLNIQSITLKHSYKSLEDIVSSIKLYLLPMFDNLQVPDTREKSNALLTRSIKFSNASAVTHQQSSCVLFILQLDTMNFVINNFLNNQKFGSLEVNLKDSLFALTESNTLLFYTKHINIGRIFDDSNTKQKVLSVIIPSNQQKPTLFAQKKHDGKLKLTLRDVAIHYYAKWLGLFRTLKSTVIEVENLINASTLFETNEAPNRIFWEIKFLNSSLNLHPYRLSSALIIVLDRFTHNGRSPTLHVRSMLKRGTLLLIDDVSNIKTLDKQIPSTLIDFYTRQGFVTLGRLDSLLLTTQRVKNSVTIDAKLDHLNLSLCADSFHTLVQTCIDLKYPETFPDDQKFKVKLQSKINTFNDVDCTFFDKSHYNKPKTSPVKNFRGTNFNKETAEYMEIMESFIDQVQSEITTGSDELSLLESSDHYVSSSAPSNSSLIEFKERYIDTSPIENEDPILNGEEENIDVKLDLELSKIILKLFDGYDWKYTRKNVSEAIDRLDKDASISKEEEDNSSTILNATVFDSIYISNNTSTVNNLKNKVTKDLQGGNDTFKTISKVNLRPSKHYKALVEIHDLKVIFTLFKFDLPTEMESHNSADLLNRCELSIGTIDIIDNVPTSTWNKFVTQLRHEHWPSGLPMISLDIQMVRPIDYLAATELIVNMNVCPLRLHIDQDMLDFLIRFGEFKDNRFELIDEYPTEVFIQKLTTNSIKVRVDYKPKKIDYSGLRSGHTTELMNFFVLDGSNIVLKGLILYGLNGFDEISDHIKEVWTFDITSKQLGGVLEGISPIKSFIRFGSGVKTLVTVLKSEYRNDGHVGRTLQKGGEIFLKTTSGDFIKLSAKLASGTQSILENVDELFGGRGTSGRIQESNSEALFNIDTFLDEDQLVGGSNPKVRGHGPSAVVIDASTLQEGEPKIVSLYADQPLDIHRGLEEAYNSLEKHMHIAYDAVWKAKGELRKNESGATAAAVYVAKAAPVAIIRPLIGLSEAISKTLQGIANQLDKDTIQDLEDKYKSRKK
ncbi:Atg2p NDAI_0F03930 [Naumovozyma dairenensis CBS 421]|uniref:Autophagy-related protein 2 n=1 Tax=Naumovozyma dairenensis (strain ATCC 10597 / BCRC 20456 / CBS 421 / NBRC 0211 / NRRL Y-12639) TaxID=1071378 RepID=G0WD50_NAUDC|nr:hypothetical protein NDAI_0F03930 [Naumovozyma dairenensis CBS 421]CCD25711.1 hypothetical protein NDAI_0F03930 [Naumovozyma dairenensis CBS 421]